MTQYINGFSVDDKTGRVTLEDSPGVYEWMGCPFDKNNLSAGEQGGTIVSVTQRVAVDANREIVYQDCAVTPYTGQVFSSGGLPHKPDGTLLCDSTGAVASSYGGLPFTREGFLCIVPSGPPPAVPTAPTNLKITGYSQDDIARFQMDASTIASGSVARYVGKDSLGGVDNDLAVTGTTSLAFTYDFGKPSQTFDFNTYAVSDKGVTSPASNTVNVTTFPDAGTILSASYPQLNALKLTWKNNPNNGNAPIIGWQFRIDNATINRVWSVNATESGGVYTATLTDIPASFCGAVKAWVIARNAAGNSSNNGSPAYPVDIPIPVIPGKVDVTAAEAVSDTSIKVTITKPTGTEPMTYSVPIIQTNPSRAFTEQVAFTFNGNVGTGTVEGLDPGATAIVGCYATNGAGQGSTGGTTQQVTMPDHSVPVAPTLDGVYPASTSVVLAYTYTDNRPGGGIEPLYYTGYASDGTNTIKREVYDPDQDLLIQGLTLGVKYDCWVTATSIQLKEGPKSNVIQVTTASQIPAPVVKSITAGDGTATAIFDPVTPDPKYTVAHYSFIAENKKNPDSPEVEGYCVSGTPFPLPNDITWSVRICAVCNPGLVPGDLSAAFEVTPEQAIAPYKPIITNANCDEAGFIKATWVKGTSNGTNNRTSGLTVDQWKVSFHCVNDKGTDFELTTAGDVMTVTTAKVGISSQWEITVSGHNSVGWGKASNPAYVAYNPSVKDPMIGGTSFDDGTYKYCVFYSNATTGYEALRTDTGANIEFEVLMVGAGGSGKGQTVSLGKGGDGGGGQLVITTLPPAAPGSVFITVPSGGTQSAGNAANTTVKEGSTVLTAIAGKNATDKNNAEGYGKQEVPKSWQTLQMFWWFEPESHFVGGTAISGEQNYPNATFCGEGGAGTKDSHPGTPQPSYCAIRWKK